MVLAAVATGQADEDAMAQVLANLEAMLDAPLERGKALSIEEREWRAAMLPS
jgi:hypothetical protein